MVALEQRRRGHRRRWSLASWLYLAVVGLYAPLLMARQGARNGQTWGKQIVGIRVVRDRRAARWTSATRLLREVVVKWPAVRLRDRRPFVVPPILDYLWPLWDDENRALHDMARVVARRARLASRWLGRGGAHALGGAGPDHLVAAGPTPTITIGTPRKSLMNSR